MSKAIHVLSRAVIINQNHILLCKITTAKLNFYFLPGGHVEHRETLEQALIRELKEELDADFVIDKFLWWVEYIFDSEDANHCHDHEYNFIYLASSPHYLFKNQNPKPLQDNSKIQLEWVNLNDLQQTKLYPTQLKTLIIEKFFSE